MEDIIFLVFLGLIGVVFATFQDFKTREISDWLNFSLIVFALGYRFFHDLFSMGSGFNFLYQGLFGLAVFFVLGNVFYYGRLFAGGDAKLLIALGPIVSIRNSFLGNIETLLLFLLVFLIIGGIYTLLTSAYISFKNIKKFKREFSKQFQKYKNVHTVPLVFAIILAFLGMVSSEITYFAFAFLIFVLPWIYVYSKAVDESSMIRKVSVGRLREGDWLYETVNVQGKEIKAKWEGLSKQEIKILKENYRGKKVKIREGVPFGLVFLMGYIFYFVLILI